MTNAQTQKMIAAAATLGWKDFVCTYVALATSRKAADGRQLKKTDGGWVLYFMGSAMFAPMTAETAYSWFQRTPGLVSLMRDADDLRAFAKS